MAGLGSKGIGALLRLAEQNGYDSGKLASALGFSTRHLRRLAREWLPCSLQRWLDDQRLAAAKVLLQQRRPVKEVAFTLGFKQASHFSRRFKRRYGVSPRACRGKSLPGLMQALAATDKFRPSQARDVLRR